MSLLPPRVLALAGLAAGSTAYAVPPNVVELQLAPDVLRTLVAERARWVDLPCPTVIDNGGELSVLDHFAVPDGGVTFLPADAAHPVVHTFAEGTLETAPPAVVVDVELYFKDLDCARDPACPFEETWRQNLPLVFALTATEDQVCTSFSGTTIPLTPELEAAVDEIGAQFPTMCADLDFTAVTSLLGADFSVNDAALALDPATERLGVRLELGSSRDPNPMDLDDWADFLAGDLAPNNGLDFSLFVEGSAVAASVGDRIVDGMTCEEPALTGGLPNTADEGCNDDVEPITPVSSSYSWWNPMVPQVDLSVSLELDGINGCVDPLVLDPATFSAGLSIDAANQAIVVDGTLDWTVDTTSVAGCGSTFVFPLGIPVEWLAVLEGIAADFNDADELDQGLPSQCTLVGDQEVSCAYGFLLPSIGLGTNLHADLTATALTGFPEGLVLEGTAAFNGTSLADMQTLTLSGKAPTWGVVGDCDSGFSLGYTGWLDARGAPGLYCADPETLAMTPMAAKDPLHQFTLTPDGVGPSGLTTLTFVPAKGWTGPTNLVATVFSNVGSASVDTGDVKKAQVSVFDPAFLELAAAEATCWKAGSSHFGVPGRFDVRWLIDPPPYAVKINGTSTPWLDTRATATLSDVTLTELIPPTVDANGVALRSYGAVATATVTVDGGSAGAFTSRATFEVPVALTGHRDGAIDAMLLERELVVPLSVTSPIRGVTSASFTAVIGADEVVATGIPLADAD